MASMASYGIHWRPGDFAARPWRAPWRAKSSCCRAQAWATRRVRSWNCDAWPRWPRSQEGKGPGTPRNLGNTWGKTCSLIWVDSLIKGSLDRVLITKYGIMMCGKYAGWCMDKRNAWKQIQHRSDISGFHRGKPRWKKLPSCQ